MIGQKPPGRTDIKFIRGPRGLGRRRSWLSAKQETPVASSPSRGLPCQPVGRTPLLLSTILILSQQTHKYWKVNVYKKHEANIKRIIMSLINHISCPDADSGWAPCYTGHFISPQRRSQSLTDEYHWCQGPQTRNYCSIRLGSCVDSRITQNVTISRSHVMGTILSQTWWPHWTP